MSVMAREAADLRQPELAEASLGELLSKLGTDVSDLVHAELQLAMVEMKEQARRAALGSVALVLAAVAGYLSWLLASFAAAWGLSEVMAPGWAFLIVAGIHVMVAITALLVGRNRLTHLDPVPRQTVETLEEDVAWARQQLS